MREITRRISFGMGVPAPGRSRPPGARRIKANFTPQRSCRARGQAARHRRLRQPLRGPLRGRGRPVWIGVHFGSRGFGHKTASGSSLSRKHQLEGHARRGRDGIAGRGLRGRLRPGRPTSRRWSSGAPTPTPVASGGERCGRSSAPGRHEVHNHHNFAWREEHATRAAGGPQGRTPAFPGQPDFVGGSMGDDAVILEGIEKARRPVLYSTVHGAGRVMSRSQAAGRSRYRKQVVDGRKVRVAELVKPGVVDWPAVQARLREQGIVLVGGGPTRRPRSTSASRTSSTPMPPRSA